MSGRNLENLKKWEKNYYKKTRDAINAFNLKKVSIDRIKNNGHYEFSNCRFIELIENTKKG